jgi:trans-aconitate methyltransferase
MENLGPGSDADTLHVLNLLPQEKFKLIVDAGCGAGRQTLTLIKALNTPVHAVDSYQPFLNRCLQRAHAEGNDHLLHLHCLDMQHIPSTFQGIDLLWSEGAAYNIGFANALATWRPAIAAGGFAAVSELSWLKHPAPALAREFFQACYPAMQSAQRNIAAAKAAGYHLLATHTLPPEAWWQGYYEILLHRAPTLLHHPDPSVRDFAAATIQEIEVFQQSEESYGYVFYILQRA